MTNSADVPKNRIAGRLKRMLDITLAVPALIVLFPLLLAVAAIVRLGSHGPALYRGKRIGRGGKPFYLLKFRTMVTDADRVGPLITAGGDPRVTAIGRVLRRTKLDELPCLWNVIRGDMSMVGPRPENEGSVQHYTTEQRRILSLRPGITSLATIKYRHEEAVLAGATDLDAAYYTIMQDKLRLELEYLARQNIRLDVAILYRTLLALFQ
jgi:lipopolysaccharide/colanic/teichoic acid biosynthesis glycosyltransferase